MWKETLRRAKCDGVTVIIHKRHMNHIATVTTQIHHASLIARVPYGVITTLRPDIAAFTVVAKHRIRCASIDSIHRRIVCLHRRHSITIRSKPIAICRVTITRCKHVTIASPRRCIRRCGHRRRVDESQPHKLHYLAAFVASMIPMTITTRTEDMCIRRRGHSMVAQDRHAASTMQIIHHHKHIMCTQLAAVEVYAKSIWTQMPIRPKSMCMQRRQRRVVRIHRHRGLDRTQISTTSPRVHRINTAEKVRGASSKTIKSSPMSRITTFNSKSCPNHMLYHCSV